MDCNFYIGQKVVCIDDNWFPRFGPVAKEPKVNEIVTICNILDKSKSHAPYKGTSIFLELEGYTMYTYHHSHFRPATENRIEEFRRLVSPENLKKFKPEKIVEPELV